MNNVETIPISNETKKKLDALRREDWSDEELLSHVVEFVSFYGISWNSFVAKIPLYIIDPLATIHVPWSTAKRVKEMCDNWKCTVNNLIRDLIYHKQSCCAYHKLKIDHLIKVSSKVNTKFFIHKPAGWTNDRFLIALLSTLEKGKIRLEDFQ
jgi:hypothetical protein